MSSPSIQNSIERATTLSYRILQAENLFVHAQSYADKRWMKGIKSFMDDGEASGKSHVVNTSTALSIISSCPDLFRPENLKAYNGINFDEVCNFYVEKYTKNEGGKRGYWESKNTTSWSPYVSALAVGAISQCALLVDVPGQREKFSTEIESIKHLLVEQAKYLYDFLDQWAAHNLGTQGLADYDHVFFAYTAMESLGSVRRAWGTILELNDPNKKAFEGPLQRMTLDFYSQMTFHLAGLTQHVDVIALTLSTYSIRKFTIDKESAIRVPDDVIHAAIDTIAALQFKTGTWDTTTPLLGAATGRVGCSSVELALCLLRIPQADQFFEKLQPCFERLLDFILRGFDSQNPMIGWGTDLRRNGNSRQTWYTFLVFSFLSHFAFSARRFAATLLLSTFRISQGERNPNWSDLGDYKSLKQTFQNKLISPWKSETQRKGRSCSAILFGPPGTGKSSIAGALAGELGWPLVEIGPSDFLRDGVDGIFSNGDRVFQRLLLLEKVVVLFDEVDELVVERDIDADKISKFLTTYMLPWLQRLRDRSSLIFLFATNHIERFDSAIRRYGRFDLIIPIGPPQNDERVRVIRAIISNKKELPESFYLALKDDAIVPPQATLGDIQRVIEKLTITQLADPIQMKEAFKPSGLLIKENEETNKHEWTDFLNASSEYST